MKEANSKDYVEKIEELKNCNLGQFYKKIKEVGSRLGESNNSTFTLPDHIDLDINIAAEKIAKHFSTISQEFPPIDAESLPQRVKKKIFHSNVTKGAPTIEEHEVYEKFEKRKLKNSTVPGDIPKKL